MYTEKDFEMLRQDFLMNFMTGTYRKREFKLPADSMKPYRGPVESHKRYLGEETYHGIFQPGTTHKRWISSQAGYARGLVLGRYYTLNDGYWKNYRARVLFLDGPKKGQLGFMSVG